MRQHIATAASGLIVGAGIAIALGSVGGDSDPGAAETTIPPTTTTTIATQWVDPAEARIGPSAVVATDLRSDNGELVLGYDVFSLTPTGGIDETDGPVSGIFGTTFGHERAVPATWTIGLPSGPISARVFGPGDRSVRFATSEPPENVTSAQIDSFWVPAPLEATVEFARSDASWHDIVPGLRVRLRQVVEQSDSFLVIVEASGDLPTYQSLAVEGSGRAWASSSRSMLGTNRWTLGYEGDHLAEPIALVVRGIAWIEVTDAADVGLDRVGSQ